VYKRRLSERIGALALIEIQPKRFTIPLLILEVILLIPLMYTRKGVAKKSLENSFKRIAILSC